jgi:CheY-like chemotaxis protein
MASDSHGVALTDSSPAERSLTVLCIEDDSASLSLIEATFGERSDVELLVATDAAEGAQMARRHPPDLVFADVDLPGMGGEEVLARLRVDPVTRPVPVVMVGADPTAGLGDRLIARGARTCLAKPLKVRELASALDYGTPRAAATL